MHNNSEHVLEPLPQEMLRCIFEFLTFQQKHRYLLVCRRWYLLLVPLAKQGHDDLPEWLVPTPFDRVKEWVVTHTRTYSTWEWSYPDEYERYDGKTIDSQTVNIQVTFTMERQANRMTRKEFNQFKLKNDMTQIDGVNYQFHASKPFFFLRKEIEPIAIDDSKNEYDNYTATYSLPDLKDEDWDQVILFLNSLNSLKFRAIAWENDSSYELVFLMRDGEVWLLRLVYSISEERYTNFNE